MLRLTGILGLILLLAGCTGADKTTAGADAVTLVLANDSGVEFTARLEGPRACLFLPDGTVELPQVEAASGAKYSDGVTTFWSMGQEAMLSRGDAPPETYTNNPARAVWEHAKLDGVDFRAVGNEPGWVLLVREGQEIQLRLQARTEPYLFPAPAPVTDPEAGRTTYTVTQDGHTLEVELSRGPCSDTMVDATYETAVRVVLDGQEYTGCGRALH